MLLALLVWSGGGLGGLVDALVAARCGGGRGCAAVENVGSPVAGCARALPSPWQLANWQVGPWQSWASRPVRATTRRWIVDVFPENLVCQC